MLKFLSNINLQSPAAYSGFDFAIKLNDKSNNDILDERYFKVAV